MKKNDIYINIDGINILLEGDDKEYFETWKEEVETEKNRIEAEQTAKAEARESAMAKLKKLGLTDDEIAALVP
jgi:hypothetical protein